MRYLPLLLLFIGCSGAVDTPLAKTSSVSAILNRGVERAKQGMNESALADLEEVLAQDPRNASALFYRGLVLSQMGNYLNAITALEECLAVDQKHARAYGVRGQIYHKKGRYREALADLEQAAQLDTENPEFANDLAWLLATCPEDSIRDGDRATQSANRAISIAGTEWKYINTYAAALAETGKYDEAIELLLTMKASVPVNMTSQFNQQLQTYELHQPWREGKPEVDLPDIFD